MSTIAERNSTVRGLSGFGGNAVGANRSALAILLADVLGDPLYARMESRTMFARSGTVESDSLRKWSAFRLTFGCATIAYVQSSD
jgi:hypothetical protein